MGGCGRSGGRLVVEHEVPTDSLKSDTLGGLEDISADPLGLLKSDEVAGAKPDSEAISDGAACACGAATVAL